MEMTSPQVQPVGQNVEAQSRLKLLVLRQQSDRLMRTDPVDLFALNA